MGNIKSNMKPVNPPLWKRIKRDELLELIHKFNGLTTSICDYLDCTFTQFWQAVKKWGFEDEVIEARKQIVYKAEEVVSNLLDSKSEGVRLKAAEATLKYRGSLIGWEQNPQVQIQQNIVSDEDTKIQIKNIFGITE